MMRWSWTQAAGQRICTRRVIQSKTGVVSIVAYGLGPTSKWRLSMSPLKTIAASAVAIALSLSAANAAEKPNIVQTAISNGSFNTLVTAVKAAGLVDTLSGSGPFTDGSGYLRLSRPMPIPWSPRFTTVCLRFCLLPSTFAGLVMSRTPSTCCDPFPQRQCGCGLYRIA
jgi:hypothetical protein